MYTVCELLVYKSSQLHYSKASILALMVPLKTFNTHEIFPFQISFSAEKGTLDYCCSVLISWGIKRSEKVHTISSDVFLHLPLHLSGTFCFSFDVVFSNWLLMYLSDQELKSLADKFLMWLRPGGHLFFRESCFHQSG